ncbi:MAG: DUF4097 family beta strand repeat protein [Oscillospiraceae bacterium]|nr:DUF4097 family beta strand repeat protein [Oscillospiraceae bacterium]
MKKAIKNLALILTASAMLCATGCINPASAFDHADQYTAGDFSTDSAIKELDIDWTAGNVTVSRHNQSGITVTETCNVELDNAQQMQTWLDGSTLHIRYCKPGVNFKLTKAKKMLEVKLPEGMELETLNCGCTSADTTLADISAKDFQAEVTSGDLQLSGCSADNFRIDATSGDITVEQKGESESLQAGSTSGKIRITAETVKNLSVKSTSGVQDISTQQSDSVSAASTSGDETLHLKTVPASVDVSATSGKVSLFVPKNADFKATVDMTSGSFDSDISLKKDGKQYTAGSGKNQMKIDTTSGNVAIKAED